MVSLTFQNILWTPSKMIDRLGREINHPDSVYYWAHKVLYPKSSNYSNNKKQTKKHIIYIYM